jgi:hypothetical protein
VGEEVATDPEGFSKQLWDWYGQASALHDAGNLGEAWALYQRIWKYRKTYDVATSLGGICFQREQYALAAHYYRIALDKMVPTQSPEFVNGVRQAYEKARAKVAELHVDVRPLADGRVPAVSLFDVDANVELEEPVFLEEGERTLEARTPGQAAVELRVAAKPGATVQWTVEFATGDDRTVVVSPERTSLRRHPWIVFPMGGLLTAGLTYGAVYNANLGVESYDDVRRLSLTPGECFTSVQSERCGRAQELREQSREADARALWFGGGAVLAAAATVTVYWLWETETPVSVGYRPNEGYGEMRFTYEF